MRQNPSAQQRQGCCSSMPPGPTSIKAEHIFTVGTHTHRACAYSSLYIYTQQATQRTQTEALSTHIDTKDVNGLILLSSLTEEDGSLLAHIYVHVHIYICTMWISPSPGLRCNLLSSCHCSSFSDSS